ncbi:MAG TPA: amino acid adenylation domain-containing protein, partial [Blastocatellia bacterium]
MRADLSGNPTFREALARVREVALGAYAHQDLPFEMIIDEIQPERTASYNPLFQVVFSMINTPAERLELPRLTISEYGLGLETEKFDLTMGMIEHEGGLFASLGYDTDLFDATTITRMLNHFRNLLEAVATGPSRRVFDLPILSEDEKRQLLAWAQPASTAFSHHECIHRMFEAQVERAPDAVAVTGKERQLTYQELNWRANQLARYLMRHGVGPEALVGISMERGTEMVVGILAILKAGGAYLPLDPTYPRERVAMMLEDAGGRLLLTQQALLERFNASQVRPLCIDAEWQLISQESRDNPSTAVTPGNMAYVIYTSGSTGRPKGVMITHHNVTRLLRATQGLFSFGPADVWSLFHSFAFDFSVWEMWGALSSGGRLVIVPYLTSRSPKEFVGLLRREGVTVLNQTPSAFYQMIGVEEEEAVIGGEQGLRLRVVIMGGEELEVGKLKGWVERHGADVPELVNMYGITETTVHVTQRRIREEEVERGEGSMIGEAIADMRVYVMGEGMQMQPEGVAGEMYVGGEGVSRGYVRRGDQTAERFVPDPLSKKAGARLYKTGDLARRLAGGDLEYLGRIDQQVKIRGFRIELGEIESVLLQHPAVREAVAVAREDALGNKRLAAYVVFEADRATNINELRSLLKEKLPDYMVPAAIIPIESLPLNANAKLDRQALPSPEQIRLESEADATSPRNTLEEKLAGIFAQAIGLERVGLDDNFFDLGGDSIRSIQVRAQALRQGLNLSIQQLFERPTVRSLARELQSAEPDSSHALKPSEFSLIPEEDRARMPGDAGDAYPLTMLQAGMIFHNAYRLETSIYHDVFSFHLRAKFDADGFQTALRKLAARHAMLRSSFHLNNFSEPLQIVHRAVDVPFEVEDISRLNEGQQDAALDAWIEAEKSSRFDLTRAPLLRFYAHLRGEHSFQLTVSFHHAILDGWSLASMLTELFRVYFSLLDGELSADAPPPRSSFRDFVAMERAALRSDETRRYWNEKLADMTFTALPRWPASGDVGGSGQVRALDVPISPEVFKGLKLLARQAATPLKSLLLASHLRVLSLLSGQADVLTGVVSNGRP